MAFLTSYRYRGVEWNDGMNFSIPFADNTLDDRNTVESTFATRGLNTPVETGGEMRESTISLNVHLIASDAETFQTRLETLIRYWDTQDPTYYQIERKLPHEAAYSYIEVSPRAISINRVERKASITLVCRDRRWKSATQQTAGLDLFNGTLTTDVTVTYSGFGSAEPTIALSPTVAGTDGVIPLYTRKVTVWAARPEAVEGMPIKLVSGWNTNAEVAAGKLRADGLSIVVDYGGGYKLNSDGTPNRPPAVYRVPRVITGSQASRAVWIRPSFWPYGRSATLTLPSGRGGRYAAFNTSDTSFYVFGDDTFYLFQAGTVVRIDDEYVSIAAIYADGTSRFRVDVAARGLYGSSVVDHYQFTPIRYPVDFYVGYGWGQGIDYVEGNNLYGWPQIDYENSSNTEWIVDDTYRYEGYYSGMCAWYWAVDAAYGYRTNWLTGWAAKTAEDDVQIVHSRGPAPVFDAMRLVAAHYHVHQRCASHIKLTVAYDTENPKVTGVPLELYAVSNDLGTTMESKRLLWSWSTILTGGNVDTGWVTTNNGDWGATHFTFQHGRNPPGGMTNASATITECRYRFLDWRWPAPQPGALGNEGGTAYGDFPVRFTVQNLSDPGTPAFTVSARMRLNEPFSVNCYSRELSGLYLSEITYTNPTWLRLVPGTNTLRFTAPAGSGRMQGQLSWYNAK